ncbi:MAG TPA: hypothetical protein VFA44_02905 [Gaiellaceae bacterium]|nr:hypothetical protein [Gaiellaceae bacterium]
MTREERLLVLAVAAYRRSHGVGPAWRAVGRVFGWSHRELEERLFAARRAGLVTFDRRPGSLDVPAAVLRRALAEQRAERAGGREGAGP